MQSVLQGYLGLYCTFIPLKTIEKLQWSFLIGIMVYKTNKHNLFNFIIFRTFSRLKLNSILKKSTLEISGVVPISNRNETC